jgi:hypothetical protein
MACYKVFDDSEEVLHHVERLRRHHDHLKTLDDCYAYMRHKETYDRMEDPSFSCDQTQLDELDRSHFTSLIVKLSVDQGEKIFSEVRRAYELLKGLVLRFDRSASVEVYFESAHITIKSLADRSKQTEQELREYIPVIAPIVGEWIKRMGPDTSLFAVGLFTNLHRAKGLSIGVKFYPSLPLIQVIRGEVGRSLYENDHGVSLRPESTFHTMLTHSTGFRARNLCFPMNLEFVDQFKTMVESFDRRVFGAVSDVRVEDVFVRNGYSDKLISVAEVSMS